MTTSIRLAVGATAAAVAATSALVAAYPAAAASRASLALPTLTINASAKSFAIPGSHTVSAGRVEVKLNAAKGQYFGGSFGTVAFRNGFTFKKMVAVQKFVAKHDDKVGNTDKAGAKRLKTFVDNTTSYGGTSAAPGTSTTMTYDLPPGRYTIYSGLKNFSTDPIVITVTGPATSRPAPASKATVKAIGDERFGGSGVLPAHGVITFTNRTRDDHFLAMLQVKPGTTRHQVAAYLKSKSPQTPPFLIGEATGTDLVSPGHSMTFTENAAKGEYLEACFFQDTKTGMQHIYMGMYRSGHLR
jgi:hypothetical protein